MTGWKKRIIANAIEEDQKMDLNFAKVFNVKRYGQIVVLKKQNDEGAPELRFYCHPEGYGVCTFSLGWNDDNSEARVEEAFKQIVMREAIEIVDGWIKHITSQQQTH
jgi:hypothetical protein